MGRRGNESEWFRMAWANGNMPVSFQITKKTFTTALGYIPLAFTTTSKRTMDLRPRPYTILAGYYACVYTPLIPILYIMR